MPIDRMRFECWNCTRPEADEARHWLRNCDNSDLGSQLSPQGRPLMCCKVRYVGTVPGDQTRVST
jgi:hypothetical protein